MANIAWEFGEQPKGWTPNGDGLWVYRRSRSGYALSMGDEVLKLRFDLDDAGKMKGGKSAPEQPVVLEVEVTTLEPELRVLLSTRMVRGAKGVFDVCRMKDPFEREFRRASKDEFLAGVPSEFPVRLKASEPTLEGLKQALREDAKRLE